jgi:hypothetical protein
VARGARHRRAARWIIANCRAARWITARLVADIPGPCARSLPAVTHHDPIARLLHLARVAPRGKLRSPEVAAFMLDPAPRLAALAADLACCCTCCSSTRAAASR